MSLSSFLPLISLLPPGVSISEGLELFFQVVQDTFTTNLVAAAAVTWIGYDICLTFAKEVELVWRARWTLPKVLYIAIRYYGLAAALFYLVGEMHHYILRPSAEPQTGSEYEHDSSVRRESCRGWAYYVAFGAGTVIVLVSEGMFLLRIWIAYGKSRMILAFVTLCYIAEITASVTVGIIEGRTVSVLPRPPGFPLPGCFTFATVSLKHTLPAWIVICATSTSYLVLMMHKFITSHAFKAELRKARRDPLTKWFQLRKLSPIVYLLIRDGVLYFAMMFCAGTLNMAITARFSHREIQSMGVPLIIAVSCVSASRLALNLRGVIGEQREHFPTTMRFELGDIAKAGVSPARSDTSSTSRPSAAALDV
ncbi:hypothetical protein GSI_09240 [Ganoderma sinense ZZ0214-1]|uniref:DUF6533 domain-containing protein n=1 Tax=Ganoderma sinense ZZ0214-1 TaxID=1077348 RepID=A0A2G8S602_9APHY|nr:hypothetical protein GSI_09240 [Ganoderma sinense ZZ0214-1]